MTIAKPWLWNIEISFLFLLVKIKIFSLWQENVWDTLGKQTRVIIDSCNLISGKIMGLLIALNSPLLFMFSEGGI